MMASVLFRIRAADFTLFMKVCCPVGMTYLLNWFAPPGRRQPPFLMLVVGNRQYGRSLSVATSSTNSLPTKFAGLEWGGVITSAPSVKSMPEKTVNVSSTFLYWVCNRSRLFLVGKEAFCSCARLVNALISP